MKDIFESKQDLYKRIVELFEKYLKDNGLTTDGIDPDKHFISRRQFFYLKNIAKGKEAPDIGEGKLNSLLNMLNLKLETSVFYKLSEK
ncbi:hypothetical protein ETU08_07570 [Apibacter muscae]|uniref:Uncharacterized protein n=1 Tax=Apibacter muscae TaxID=2509004 RepID=A0A563DAV5_9FLAO|nr:hypothetical protein [Apibacter muscae]TWP23138.1 hypothetical protein ETU10_08565 [Apibacter muscae]TWP27073.1 hypothetical protein ETU09_08105 [Apibacter muscae]TWP29351.1 hypothetical protein ETU08_07570 [Apibacter muscae]